MPSAGALYVLIYLDAEGAPLYRVGSATATNMLGLDDIPSLMIGEIPLAAVKLYAGQTAITENQTTNDIVDLRFPQTRWIEHLRQRMLEIEHHLDIDISMHVVG